MENLLFLGVPILKHIRVGFSLNHPISQPDTQYRTEVRYLPRADKSDDNEIFML